MGTQKISRKNLHIIYNSNICGNWKNRIVEELVKSRSDEIEVSNSTIMEAYNAADTNQKQMLDKYFNIESPAKTMKKINNFNDILKTLGKTMEEILPYKNPKTKAQISQNGLAKIQCITEVYNNGEVLDFDNKNQRKYYIWWQKNSRGGWVVAGVGCDDYCAALPFGCYFVNEKLARDAGKKFANEFKEYLL